MATTAKIETTPEAIQASLHLTPQQQNQLQRIVLAGQKVMFDAKTHKMMLDQIKAPGNIAQKLGQSIAGLMGLLWQESRNSLPPNLMIPSGMVLMAHAAKFMNQAGQTVTPTDFAVATKVMVTAILKAGGVDPDKLAEYGGKGIGKESAAQPAAPTGAQQGAMK
jgi:hypothetical protein